MTFVPIEVKLASEVDIIAADGDLDIELLSEEIFRLALLLVK